MTVLILRKVKNKIVEVLSDLRYEMFAFLLFVLTRLNNLGYDMFNTDVWKWKSRIYDFGEGIFTLSFEKTLQRYHPGVTLMWLGALGVKLQSFYYKVVLGFSPPDNDIQTVFILHFFQKIVIVLALGLAVAAIFFALKKIAGISLAVIFVLLLNFEPFYIALTRVVHLEGLLATFMLAAFLWFYLAFIHQSDVAPQNKKFYHNKSFLFASFFAACAVLTKTSALIILPTFGLMLYFNSKNIISSLKYYIPWLVLVSVFFILLWPAMWVQPVSVLNELSKGIFDTGVEEGHIQLYFGELVDDPGPTFYFVVLLLRSSLYMIPGFLLTLFSYKKLSNSKKKFIKYTLFFSAMYFIEMTIPTKKLDRYILPALVLQLMTSAVGLEYFFRELFVTKIKAVYKYLVAICFILPAFFTYLYLNGDYFSYYSPYFGGLRVGIKVLEPKWLIGQKQIKGFFSDPVVWADFEPFAKEESLDGLLYKSTINERLLVGFPEKYYTQVWPFIREVGAWATIKTLTPQAVKTAYFVYPVWDDTSADEDRFEIEYLGSISERGVKLYNVYRSCRIFDCGREN